MAVPQSTESPNGTNGSLMTAPPQPTNGASLDMDTTASTTVNDLTSTDSGLTSDEIALYDRQIRLWGAQAQERIRSAHILLISLRALGTEIAKNLTLAGISSLTIIDDEAVTEEDLGTGYFLREDDVGKPRAEAAIPRIRELNPRVTIKSDGDLPSLLTKDQTYYLPFSCIIACDHDFLTLSLLNTAARVAQRPFYAAGIHGMYGYIFADLFGHEFVVEREKSNVPTQIGAETITRAVLEVSTKPASGATNGATTAADGASGANTSGKNRGKTVELVKKQEIYCPLILANSSPLPMEILNNRRKLKSVPALLPCLRALFDFQRTNMRLPHKTSHEDLQNFTQLATAKARELMLPPETLQASFLRSFLQNLGAEIVPVAAFVGGRLSEDVINVLGKREQPIQNFALFDGEALDGRIYCLFTMPPELSMGMDMAGGVGGDMSMGAGLGMPDGMNGLNGFAGAMDGMNGLGGDFGMPNMGMDMGNGMGMEFMDAAGLQQNGIGGAGLAGLGDAGIGMTGVDIPIQQPQQGVSGAMEEAMPVETAAAPDKVTAPVTGEGATASALLETTVSAATDGAEVASAGKE